MPILSLLKIGKIKNPKSLTNGRGSWVAGCGSKVAVAGLKSRSRVQCLGRGSKVAVSNVAVAGLKSRSPMSQSRVQCRGHGSNVEAGENDLEFEITE